MAFEKITFRKNTDWLFTIHNDNGTGSTSGHQIHSRFHATIRIYTVKLSSLFIEQVFYKHPSALLRLMVSGGLFQRFEAVLGKTVRPLSVKAHFHQRIRIIDRGVRIGDNAVQTNILVHIILPGLIIRFSENLNLLSPSKGHSKALSGSRLKIIFWFNLCIGLSL